MEKEKKDGKNKSYLSYATHEKKRSQSKKLTRGEFFRLCV